MNRWNSRGSDGIVYVSGEITILHSIGYRLFYRHLWLQRVCIFDLWINEINVSKKTTTDVFITNTCS